MKFWIKLYHEILDDPKMGRLSDHLWRRAIEMFLLAGKTGDGGELPQVSEIAWILRTDESEIIETLRKLEDINIVHCINDKWIVTHFQDRQDAETAAERAKRFRSGKRNESVTKSSQNVTRQVTNCAQELEVESDIESDIESELEVESDENEKTPTPAAEPRKPFQLEKPQTAIDARRVYTAVTGMVAFPMREQDKAIEMIISLGATTNDIVGYLKPFWQAWISRKARNGMNYSRTSYGWLDWAVSGEVPEEGVPYIQKTAAQVERERTDDIIRRAYERALAEEQAQQQEVNV